MHGQPVQGAVAQPGQRSPARLHADAEGRRVPAGLAVGHHSDAGHRRTIGPRPEGQGDRPQEHAVDHDAVGGVRLEDRPDVTSLSGHRADEDAAQVVLDPTDAPLGRRLALGVDHHEVVGVEGLLEGEELRPRRLHPLLVVRGRVEGDLVALFDQPARHGQQWHRVPQGRGGAEQVAPASRYPCTLLHDQPATTAPLQAGSSSASSTCWPSRAWSVATSTEPRTEENVAGPSDMLSSTVVASPLR